jgi:hypothetical protein
VNNSGIAIAWKLQISTLAFSQIFYIFYTAPAHHSVCYLCQSSTVFFYKQSQLARWAALKMFVKPLKTLTQSLQPFFKF